MIFLSNLKFKVKISKIKVLNTLPEKNFLKVSSSILLPGVTIIYLTQASKNIVQKNLASIISHSMQLGFDLICLVSCWNQKWQIKFSYFVCHFSEQKNMEL
jgi:hypothetical protein